MLRAMLTMLLLAMAAGAVAKDQISKRKLNAEDFTEAKNYVIKEIRTSKRYAEMSGSNRDKVVEVLNRMEDQLHEAGSVENMSESERVALFNDQELVNNLLAQAAEDSRLICKRERRTGSNMATTVCHTVAERERMMRDSRESMRQKQRMQEQAVGGG